MATTCTSTVCNTAFGLSVQMPRPRFDQPWLLLQPETNHSAFLRLHQPERNHCRSQRFVVQHPPLPPSARRVRFLAISCMLQYVSESDRLVRVRVVRLCLGPSHIHGAWARTLRSTNHLLPAGITHLRDTLLVLSPIQRRPCDPTRVLSLQEERFGFAILEAEYFAVTADVELALQIRHPFRQLCVP